MKRITFLIGLFLLSFFGFGQSTNNNRLQTIETFRKCQVPLTTFNITKDKSFWGNIKSKSLNIDFLKKYIINDTTELGEFYKRPAMDNPNIIMRGYIKYDYYGYGQIADTADKTVFLVYVLRNEDDVKYFVVALGGKKTSTDRLLLMNEVLDKDFSESVILPNLEIDKVVYAYVSDEKTLITLNRYLYNRQANTFKLVETKKQVSSKFYYEYKKHNLPEDPLTAYNN